MLGLTWCVSHVKEFGVTVLVDSARGHVHLLDRQQRRPPLSVASVVVVVVLASVLVVFTCVVVASVLLASVVVVVAAVAVYMYIDVCIRTNLYSAKNCDNESEICSNPKGDTYQYIGFEAGRD